MQCSTAELRAYVLMGPGEMGLVDPTRGTGPARFQPLGRRQVASDLMRVKRFGGQSGRSEAASRGTSEAVGKARQMLLGRSAEVWLEMRPSRELLTYGILARSPPPSRSFSWEPPPGGNHWLSLCKTSPAHHLRARARRHQPRRVRPGGLQLIQGCLEVRSSCCSCSCPSSS